MRLGWLPSFKRGQRPKASDLQAMVEAIEELRTYLSTVQGGAGIDVINSAAGMMIALSGGGKSRWEWAKIFDAPPYAAPVLPSACLYGIRGLDASFEMTDVLPEYGRPCFLDECHIYPAKVGAMCMVLRNPQDGGGKIAEMFVFGEQVVRGGCG